MLIQLCDLNEFDMSRFEQFMDLSGIRYELNQGRIMVYEADLTAAKDILHKWLKKQLIRG